MVRSAHCPYGSALARVFTEMSAPSHSPSMYAAMAASRGRRRAKSQPLRGRWSGAERLPYPGVAIGWSSVGAGPGEEGRFEVCGGVSGIPRDARDCPVRTG